MHSNSVHVYGKAATIRAKSDGAQRRGRHAADDAASLVEERQELADGGASHHAHTLAIKRAADKRSWIRSRLATLAGYMRNGK